MRPRRVKGGLGYLRVPLEPNRATIGDKIRARKRDEWQRCGNPEKMSGEKKGVKRPKA